MHRRSAARLRLICSLWCARDEAENKNYICLFYWTKQTCHLFIWSSVLLKIKRYSADYETLCSLKNNGWRGNLLKTKLILFIPSDFILFYCGHSELSPFKNMFFTRYHLFCSIYFLSNWGAVQRCRVEQMLCLHKDTLIRRRTGQGKSLDEI